MGRDGSSRRETRRAVLAFGIDNLGVLEELFGEALGDEVVAVLGQRLARAVPVGADLAATPYRRFLVGLSDVGVTAAAAMFKRLKAVTAEPIETSFGPVAVTLSAGCAIAAPPEAARADRAGPEREALQALHAAMARGVGSFQLAGEDRALIPCREGLAAAARAAGDARATGGGERVTVAFQPVVRASGGDVIAFHECLARISRPDGSLIRAGDFMPQIERLGLAPIVDRQVLAIALRTLTRHPGARLSVNIFPQTMQDAAWITAFERATDRRPALADRLIVEVTETCSMLDPDRTLTFMERLRRRGVAFALDDFGAGHSSFRHLREFRFDMVKIDGRFVRDIRPGSDEEFFIGKLIEIARHFEMMTVAEAVQRPEEARCLSDLGIEFFQGFWFGSPTLRLSPTSSPMPGVAAQA